MLPDETSPRHYCRVTLNGFEEITVKSGTMITVGCAAIGFNEGTTIFVGRGGFEQSFVGGPDVRFDAEYFEPIKLTTASIMLDGRSYESGPLSGQEWTDLGNALLLINNAVGALQAP